MKNLKPLSIVHWMTCAGLSLVALSGPVREFRGMGQGASETQIYADVSGSGAGSFVGQIVPSVVMALGAAPLNRPLRYQEIGGNNRVVNTGPLSAVRRDELIAFALASQPIMRGTGSDISDIVVRGAASSPSRPLLLAYAGDGREDRRRRAIQVRPGQFAGVRAVLLATNNDENTFALAQSLKVGGAQVIVTNSPAQFGVLVREASLGHSAAWEAGRTGRLLWTPIGFGLLALTLALGPVAWTRGTKAQKERIERAQQAREMAEKEEQERIKAQYEAEKRQARDARLRQLQENERIERERQEEAEQVAFALPSMTVRASVRGGAKSVTRTLGGYGTALRIGTLAASRDDQDKLDLLLPFDGQQAALVRAVDAKQVEVRNVGAAPIVVGAQKLQSRGTTILPLPFQIQFSYDHAVELELASEEVLPVNNAASESALVPANTLAVGSASSSSWQL